MNDQWGGSPQNEAQRTGFFSQKKRGTGMSLRAALAFDRDGNGARMTQIQRTKNGFEKSVQIRPVRAIRVPYPPLKTYRNTTAPTCVRSPLVSIFTKYIPAGNLPRCTATVFSGENATETKRPLRSYSESFRGDNALSLNEM